MLLVVFVEKLWFLLAVPGLVCSIWLVSNAMVSNSMVVLGCVFRISRRSISMVQMSMPVAYWPGSSNRHILAARVYIAIFVHPV